MKKSKFLLLGSVASMAAIPFVAAKCGGTKKKETKIQQTHRAEVKTNSTPSTSTTVDLSKLDQTIQAQLNKLAKDGVKKRSSCHSKNCWRLKRHKKLKIYQQLNSKIKKLVIAAKEGSKLVSGKYEFSAQSKSDTLMESNKIDLNKLEESVKQELNKLAKNNVLFEDVLDVLKKVQGLKSLRLGDIKTVEFKDNKLIIEANKDSKLVSGKYEFVAQTDSDTSTTKPNGTDQPAKPSKTEQPAKPNMENLGNFIHDPSRYNSVSQKKIKDKIEKMLGTKDFHLNVDYNKNVAKVTTKDKVILYKFTTYSTDTRPANNTDEIGTDIGRLLPKYE
ncbi:variable surface lipoprotein [Mycoplasmopsis agalactiae]|uniref:variable surface lipoprotein n=1 Tax=Mycoplasmopsis agalactiae TaxID=2110 RepID=UPI002F406ED7